MKLSKLIEDLTRSQERINLRGEEDPEVVIRIGGMPWSNAEINSVSEGADWHQGKILIYPKTYLQEVPKKLK